MKIRSFITIMVAAVAVVFGLNSCGSDDDDEPEAALASQVAGSYSGEEILTVMGDGFNSNTTYVFTKASDTSIDMTIPESTGGSMNLPKLLVKNITLTKGSELIEGKLASFNGTVTNAQGEEKAYTVSDVTVLFHVVHPAVVVTYTLKYGNMPFAFAGEFTGTKK